MIITFPDFEHYERTRGWFEKCAGCHQRRPIVWVNFCGHGINLCGTCLKIVETAADRIEYEAEQTRQARAVEGK